MTRISARSSSGLPKNVAIRWKWQRRRGPLCGRWKHIFDGLMVDSRRANLMCCGRTVTGLLFRPLGGRITPWLRYFRACWFRYFRASPAQRLPLTRIRQSRCRRASGSGPEPGQDARLMPRQRTDQCAILAVKPVNGRTRRSAIAHQPPRSHFSVSQSTLVLSPLSSTSPLSSICHSNSLRTLLSPISRLGISLDYFFDRKMPITHAIDNNLLCVIPYINLSSNEVLQIFILQVAPRQDRAFLQLL